MQNLSPDCPPITNTKRWTKIFKRFCSMLGIDLRSLVYRLIVFWVVALPIFVLLPARASRFGNH